MILIIFGTVWWGRLIIKCNIFCLHKILFILHNFCFIFIYVFLWTFTLSSRFCLSYRVFWYTHAHMVVLSLLHLRLGCATALNAVVVMLYVCTHPTPSLSLVSSLTDAFLPRRLLYYMLPCNKVVVVVGVLWVICAHASTVLVLQAFVCKIL